MNSRKVYVSDGKCMFKMLCIHCTLSHNTANSHFIFRLVQQLKDSPTRSTANYQITTKIAMASDAIQVYK